MCSKLLANRPVVGLISGHQHALYQARLNPISGPLHLLGSPALCGGWWRGDMSYQGIPIAPGFLLAWLSRDQAGWPPLGAHDERRLGQETLVPAAGGLIEWAAGGRNGLGASQ